MSIALIWSDCRECTVAAREDARRGAGGGGRGRAEKAQQNAPSFEGASCYPKRLKRVGYWVMRD